MIKGILLDSGKVLNHPVTNHWFITPHFFDFVNENKFKAISKKVRDKAFRTAYQHLNQYPLIINLEEEFILFKGYYTLLFKEMNYDIDEQSIIKVTNDLVYNPLKYKFYDDVFTVLPKLKEKYSLALISDAWPSLVDVFKENNVDTYFKSMIISQMVGYCKPDKEMYELTLKDLELSPNEVIFVDDSIGNCNGAKALGIKSYLMCRNRLDYLLKKITIHNHIVINSLTQLDEYNK